MAPSTKDQIEGKVHEVKGNIKEKAGRSRITLTWWPKAKTRRSPAKSKRKSARLKRCSRSEVDGALWRGRMSGHTRAAAVHRRRSAAPRGIARGFGYVPPRLRS